MSSTLRLPVAVLVLAAVATALVIYHYIDRDKIYGEEAAMQWAVSKFGRK